MANPLQTPRRSEALGSPFWAGVRGALGFSGERDDPITGAPLADDGHVFSETAGEAPIPVAIARADQVASDLADLALGAVPVGRVAAPVAKPAANLIGKAAGSLITRAMFGGAAARFARSSGVGLARAAASRLAGAGSKAVVDRSLRTFAAPDAAKRGAMALNARSLGVSDAGTSRALRTLREARITLDRAAIAKKQAAGQPLTRAERSFFNHTYTAMPEHEARSVEQAVTKYLDARKALAAGADAAKSAELKAAVDGAEKAMLARLDSAQLSDHRLDRGLMALGELSRRLARATPGSVAKASVVWPWRATGGLAVSGAQKGYSVGSGIASGLIGHGPIFTVPAGAVGGLAGAALGAAPAAGVVGIGYGAYKHATRPVPQPLPKPVAAPPQPEAQARKPFDPYAEPAYPWPARREDETPGQRAYRKRRERRRRDRELGIKY